MRSRFASILAVVAVLAVLFASATPIAEGRGGGRRWWRRWWRRRLRGGGGGSMSRPRVASGSCSRPSGGAVTPARPVGSQLLRGPRREDPAIRVRPVASLRPRRPVRRRRPAQQPSTGGRVPSLRSTRPSAGSVRRSAGGASQLPSDQQALAAAKPSGRRVAGSSGWRSRHPVAAERRQWRSVPVAAAVTRPGGGVADRPGAGAATRPGTAMSGISSASLAEPLPVERLANRAEPASGTTDPEIGGRGCRRRTAVRTGWPERPQQRDNWSERSQNRNEQWNQRVDNRNESWNQRQDNRQQRRDDFQQNRDDRWNNLENARRTARTGATRTARTGRTIARTCGTTAATAPTKSGTTPAISTTTVFDDRWWGRCRLGLRLRQLLSRQSLVVVETRHLGGGHLFRLCRRAAAGLYRLRHDT